MARPSNFFLGFLNFLSLLCGLIAIAFSLYIHFHGGTACQNSLYRPLLTIGILLSIVSLLGLFGSWCKNNFLLYLYLIVMFLLIIGFAVFAGFVFVLTNNDAGKAVSGIGFREYRLGNYSSWLQNHFVNDKNWNGIRSCLVDAHVCRSLAKNANQNQTAADFYKRNLSPVQSGCCKPPIDCGFEYKNSTFWIASKSGISMENSECFEWSNKQDRLCYNCNSCKAGVLNTIKRQWRNLAIANVFFVVLFIIIYLVGVCAGRNNRADRYNYGYGHRYNP